MPAALLDESRASVCRVRSGWCSLPNRNVTVATSICRAPRRHLDASLADESERARLKKVEVAAVRVPFDGAVAVTHSGIARPQTSLLFLIAQARYYYFRVVQIAMRRTSEPRV